MFGKLRLCGRIEHRRPHAAVADAVDHHRRPAAGWRQHGNAISAGNARPQQRIGGPDHVVGIVEQKNATFLARRGQDRV